MGRGGASVLAEEARASVGACASSSAFASPCTVTEKVAMGPFFPLLFSDY